MLRSISRVAAFQSNLVRNFHISSVPRLREIMIEKKGEKTTVIDCKIVKSPREPFLLRVLHDTQNDKCPLCRLQLDLKHTDVLILCQYLDSEGNLLNFKDTHLCRQQYKLITELVYMAQYAGLLPEPPSDEPKKPYRLLNTYYDETTIAVRPRQHKRDIRLYYLKKKLSPIQRFRVKPDEGAYYGQKHVL